MLNWLADRGCDALRLLGECFAEGLRMKGGWSGLFSEMLGDIFEKPGPPIGTSPPQGYDVAVRGAPHSSSLLTSNFSSGGIGSGNKRKYISSGQKIR